MRGILWNRFSIPALLAVIAASISLFCVLPAWHSGGTARSLMSIPVFLFVLGVYLEAQAAVSAFRFTKEDAQKIYSDTAQLIFRLRELAPELHKEYDLLPQGKQKYLSDKRYRQLMKDFSRVKSLCKDYAFYRKMNELIEFEIIMAKYRINLNKSMYRDKLELTEKKIFCYINTRLKSRSA